MASCPFRKYYFYNTYTVAVSDFYADGGFYNILHDCTLVAVSDLVCRDVVRKYLQTILGGVIPDEYRTTQGRITIVND